MRKLLLATIAFVLAFGVTAGYVKAESKAVKPKKPFDLISKDMILVKKIKLKTPGANHQLLATLVADDPKGGLWVAWHSDKDSVLQHFDDTLKPDRESIRLENHTVMGLYGHRDGRLSLTWRESHMKAIFGVVLYLKKITPLGKTVWNTKVRGDKGANLEYEKRPVGLWHHPDYQGPVVPIAFNGRQYGLFYVVLQKFPDKGCHTGDEFASVNANGSLTGCVRHSWNASHSMWMSAVVGPRGGFYGITYATPWPFFGIRISAFSSRPARHSLLWPASAWKAGGDMPLTRLSPAFRMGNFFGMAISSGVSKKVSMLRDTSTESVKTWVKDTQKKKSAYQILLRFGTGGKIAASTYLTTELTPDIVVSGARIGRDSAVVAWGNGPGNMKGEAFGVYPVEMAVLTNRGSIVQSPIPIAAPLTWGSNLTTLKNGDVAWAGMADEWTSVDDRNTLYLVRVKCPKKLLRSTR